MVRCEHCGKNVDEIPWKCKRCGKTLCEDHRLPEDHDCDYLKTHPKKWGRELPEVKKKTRGRRNVSTRYTPMKKDPFWVLKRKVQGFLFWLNKRKYRKYDYANRLGSMVFHIFMVIILSIGIYALIPYFSESNMLLINFIPVGWLILGVLLWFVGVYIFKLLKEIPNFFKRQRNYVKIFLIIIVLLVGVTIYQERNNITSPLNSESLKGYGNKITDFFSDTAQDFGIGERDYEKIEYTILRETNLRRQASGKDPLKLDPELNIIAREHSQDMLARNFYDHNNPDGDGPTERALAKGIRVSSGGWYGIAENIAVVYIGNDEDCSTYDEDSLGDCLVDKWMSSPGHRENILDSKYLDIGIGVACGSSECYATQDFR